MKLLELTIQILLRVDDATGAKLLATPTGFLVLRNTKSGHTVGLGDDDLVVGPSNELGSEPEEIKIDVKEITEQESESFLDSEQ